MWFVENEKEKLFSTYDDNYIERIVNKTKSNESNKKKRDKVK